MKEFLNGWLTQSLGWMTTAIIIALNVLLLIWQLVAWSAFFNFSI